MLSSTTMRSAVVVVIMFAVWKVGDCLSGFPEFSDGDWHHRLTRKELLKTFGVDLHEHVPDYDVHKVTLLRQSPRRLKVKIGDRSPIDLYLNKHLTDLQIPQFYANMTEGHEEVHQIDSMQMSDVYQDHETMTSLVIDHTSDGVLALHGVHGNIMVAPVPQRHQSRPPMLKRHINPRLSHGLHVVFNRTVSLMGQSDVQVLDVESQRTHRSTRVKRDLNNRRKRAWFPEVLVVVDGKLKDSHNKAYLVNFMNAVNLRFKGIPNPVITFSVVGAVFMELDLSGGSGSHSARPTTHVKQLTGVLSRLLKSSHNLPRFDVPLLMTSYDLCGNQLLGYCDDKVKGFATINAVCMDRITSFAMVEEFGAYSAVNIASHELAHFLGAQHDDDPQESCRVMKHSYLMASRNNFSRYTPRWSRCSVRKFNQLAEDRRHMACLANVPRQFEAKAWLRGMPGLLMSRDDQCQKLYGTSAYKKYSSDCLRLFCHHPTRRGYYQYDSMPPDGTECGRSSVCVLGECKKIK